MSPSAGDSSDCRETWRSERAIIESHRRIWDQKPTLQRVYRGWFGTILDGLPRGAVVLEIGAGPGFLALQARRQRPDLRWIASDLLSVSGIDLVADAIRLPLRDASVGAIVAFDVLHHIAQPGAFFGEAARVLATGGRILLLEPWISPFSILVYGLVHHEACGLRGDPWHPFDTEHSGGKAAFDGDLAVPWRLVRKTHDAEWDRYGLTLAGVRRLNGLAYFLTRGFQPGSLLPEWAAGALLGFDALTSPVSALLAARALLTFERLPRRAKQQSASTLESFGSMASP